MLISFDTKTIKASEIIFIRHFLKSLLNDTYGTTPAKQPEITAQDVAALASIVAKVDEPNTNFVNESTADPSEYEPDEDGPGEEDGPWAPGYAERSGANAPPVTIVDASGEYEPDDADDCPLHEDGMPTSSLPGLEAPVVPPPPPAQVSPPPAPAAQKPAEVSTGASQSVAINATITVNDQTLTATADELDSDGKPWDATIHSETRAKNKDGTWRNRRHAKNVQVKQAIPGLEAMTPNSVPAPPRERKMVRTFVYVGDAQDIISAPENATDEELSAITGKPTSRNAPVVETATVVATVAPPPPAAAVVPPPPAASYAGTTLTEAMMATSRLVPPPPAAVPPVVKTAPQGSPIGTWAELMERVTKYFGQQMLTSLDVAEVCKTFNIGSIQEVAAQPNLISLVAHAIDEKVAAKGAK